MGKNGAEERQPESRRPRVAAAYGRRAFFKAGAALTVFAGSAFVPAATRSQTKSDSPCYPTLDEAARLSNPEPSLRGTVSIRKECRSSQARSSRDRDGGGQFSPLQDMYGTITPNGLCFERHHAGVPQIDPAEHRLLIHGLVDRPLVFTMDDLLRFPSVSRIHFLECSGNTQNWESVKPEFGVQQTHGLVMCCEWTGVLLSTLLDEVAVKPEAKWVLAEGADAAAMTRSVPMAKALDDAIVVYAQNGERLRREQGYPLRLLLPGFEGNMNIKWLRRLKLGDKPWQSREETSKYTDLMPDGKARQFTFIMEAKSVITRPSGGQKLTGGPGFYEITGLAWTGRGRHHQG